MGREGHWGESKLGIGVGIGVGIERLDSDPDPDADPDNSGHLREKVTACAGASAIVLTVPSSPRSVATTF